MKKVTILRPNHIPLKAVKHYLNNYYSDCFQLGVFMDKPYLNIRDYELD